MKESYIIAIDRPGMGDIPELVRCQTIDAAVEMVRVLLSVRDPNILRVRVEIARTLSMEKAV